MTSVRSKLVPYSFGGGRVRWLYGSGVCAASFLLISSVVAADDTSGRVTGQVVDEAGRPVPGASVSALWGANGQTWDRVRGNKEPEKLWQNEGNMQPWNDDIAVTNADGHFSITAPGGKNWLLAYDRERRHGA